MLHGNRAVKELAHASSLCGACQEACPVKIDIPRMLIELREHLDQERIAPLTERMIFKAFAWLLTKPALYRLSTRVGRLAQRPFMKDERLQRLPAFFRGWTDHRDLPPIARRPFRDRWRELEKEP